MYATDESQNSSTTVDLTIVVEDRDNCDFRNVKFGDSKETVKRYEDLEILNETDTYFEFETILAGETASLYYLFNSEDKFYQVEYYFLDHHTNYSFYIESFHTVTEKLTKKYGAPFESIAKKGNLYHFCTDEAQALSIGQVSFQNIWKFDNMNINIELYSDNYEIVYKLTYQSEKIGSGDEELNML